MDFSNRSVRPNQPTAPGAGEPEGTNHNTSSKNSGGKISKIKNAKWLNISWIALLFSVTVVIVALLAAITLSEAKNEEKFVDKGKMQAVFLNNGQVYFGNITELNSSYLNMSNIYYLRVNQQVQPGQQASQNDVSLVKLGCELHGPVDLMTVNRDQITFWENLKEDGQVAQAVAEYVKQNPNGQNCEQQAQQTPAPSSDSTSNDTNTTNNTDTGTDNTTNNTDTNNGTSSQDNN